MRRQDLVYRIIQAQAARNGSIVTEGVLERLSEGYGFLRAPESSYLPGPDDVYVSPSSSAASACRPATPSPVPSARPATASGTSRWRASTPSTPGSPTQSAGASPSTS